VADPVIRIFREMKINLLEIAEFPEETLREYLLSKGAKSG